MRRDEKGRFVRSRMTAAEKQKISRGQIERHRRQHAAVIDQPTHKKCSRADCERFGQWLKIPDDFPMRKRKLKSGEVRVSPTGECKRCSRKRADAWKARFIEEHGEEAFKERMRVWNSKRDAEAKRCYNREYQRMKSAETVKNPRGPWKKYRHEVGGQLHLVPAQPFVEWFLSLNGSTPTEAQMGPNVAKAVRRAIKGDPNHPRPGAAELADRRIRLDIVDEVGVLVGVPHLIHVLYPNS